MNFEDCIKKNLLRENGAAREWVKNELKTAEKFFEQAEVILKAGQYEAAEIISYAAIFHLARALLYSKGYSEKSHYCLLVAVNKLFGEEVRKVCKKAQYLREARHNVIYGGKDVSKDEAEYAVSLVKAFKKVAKKTLA